MATAARKTSKVLLIGVFLAVFGVCYGFFSMTNASAAESVSHTLTITVVGDEPLINLAGVTKHSTDNGNQLSVVYHYQYVYDIDFVIVSADGTELANQRIKTDTDSIAGTGQVDFSLSDLPDGSYSILAKASGSLGNAEDSSPFSYVEQTVILASAAVPAGTIEALEKTATLPKTTATGISSADRLLTAITLGLFATIGSAFVLEKLGRLKRRELVPDSAITFE